jgi:hypothetical protein
MRFCALLSPERVYAFVKTICARNIFPIFHPVDGPCANTWHGSIDNWNIGQLIDERVYV